MQHATCERNRRVKQDDDDDDDDGDSNNNNDEERRGEEEEQDRALPETRNPRQAKRWQAKEGEHGKENARTHRVRMKCDGFVDVDEDGIGAGVWGWEGGPLGS